MSVRLPSDRATGRATKSEPLSSAVLAAGSMDEVDDGTEAAGLGLAIARELAAAHGGTVTVGEAPGGGAEVRIALPKP